MTTELAHSLDRDKRRRKTSAPGGAMIFAVRLVLFWERLWPAILPAVATLYAIAVISLFGLWRFIPAWLHWTTIVLAGAVFVSLLWRDLKGFQFPSRRMAQARLEEDGDVAHSPLQALDDTPFDGAPSDDMASALWRAHMEASRESARQARFRGVRAMADDRDPYALRWTAIGLLAVALIAAGDDWGNRLMTALAPGEATVFGRFAADIWIEPPDYTGKAPIYLMRPGEKLSGLEPQINAPEGSVLIAQINGRGRPHLQYDTRDVHSISSFDRNGAASRATLDLNESGLVILRLGSQEVRWPIGVLADDAPSASFTENPLATEDAFLSFTILTGDDYGVTNGQLLFRLDPEQERPLDAPALDEAALLEIRSVDIPGVVGAAGERTVSIDLQEDPWAGLTVLVKVIVMDGAGQMGETREASVTLPQRVFFNPLAKAVIEQRQTLSIAAEDWKRAGRSFDALTLAPEIFYGDDLTDYLLLRAAFWRVMRQDGDGYGDAIENFWPLALQLEDEALELARQRLEAAEDALREAIERGASESEIARLVEEMRQAMNDYLAALAQSGQPMDASRAQNVQQLDQSDLDKMLDSIRDLAQSGADNAARQMLSDLQNMLSNLQLTQGGQGNGSGVPGEGGQSGQGDDSTTGRAGALIGRQRELADDTFERRLSREGNSDDLAERQRGLDGELDELIGEFQGDDGADPGGAAARSFDEARDDMGEARQALENGGLDAAASAMDRAISNLRDGAEGLAREQMRQANQGREGGDGTGVDPLGRPTGRVGGEGVEVPETSDVERTRAVIEELRRRLGEPGRSDEEIDYLERLLDRF